MGKVLSLLTRPIRTFNIDNRASRIISRDKPERAPLPEKSEKQFKLAQKLNPNFLEEHYKKDAQLDDYLKTVFVTSTQSKRSQIEEKTQSNRPLPQSRLSTPESDFGYYESESVHPGKCSLRQAVEFLSKHAEDKDKYTSKYVAQEYKIDEEVAECILKYCKVHAVYLPKDGDTSAMNILKNAILLFEHPEKEKPKEK